MRHMYFNPDFQQFFIDLAANNNKEWFDANRKRYTSQVKQPFEHFVSELIKASAKLIPGVDPDPKKAIFRINRDIRFSPDKTPYKLHSAAYLSPYGKKDPNFAGFYFQFGPEHLMLAGGVYSPDAAQLLRLRKHLLARHKEFYALTNAPEFKRIYGSVKGDENKRISDKELMEASKQHPILLKKQLYFESNPPADTVERDDLMQFMLEHIEASLPLAHFFESALSAPKDDW